MVSRAPSEHRGSTTAPWEAAADGAGADRLGEPPDESRSGSPSRPPQKPVDKFSGELHLPDAFVCPITGCMMRVPVVLPNGTY